MTRPLLSHRPDAPTSVTIPVWIWPWDAWLRTPVQARTIDIRESSTNAPIDSITAVGAELRNATGESAGIELVPDPAPLHLDKGAGGQIKLNLPAAPDPGSYTSKLKLYPKSQPAKSIDVTLKVRDYFGWLLLLIALGVGGAAGPPAGGGRDACSRGWSPRDRRAARANPRG